MTASSPRRFAKDIDHEVVYRREDQFSGWPHVMGFWQTGSGELIANFLSVDVDYSDPAMINHDRFSERRARGDSGRMGTVRSTDKGRTWSEAEFGVYPRLATGGEEDAGTFADSGPIDYLDGDVLVGVSSTNFGTPESRSFVRISPDAGRTWSPSAELPLEGLHGLSAQQSSLVRSDGRCLLFLTAVDESGWNRRPLVYASTDEGTEFHFLSFITPKVDPWASAEGDWGSTYRFGGHRWFYPRGYLLPSGRILCTLRCQRDPRGIMWTELYASDDGGRTWEYLSRVNDFGAPGSLVALEDGRIVVVYGYRLMPSGVRAAVSDDGGRTWGPEQIIRNDGGSWDLGYPNAYDAGDGQVGVLYYFNSKDDPQQANGGVRHVVRSIFTPE